MSDPHSLPESWRKFFDGLSEDEKLIYKDLNGPSWSPEKKIKEPKSLLLDKTEEEDQTTDLKQKSITSF